MTRRTATSRSSSSYRASGTLASMEPVETTQIAPTILKLLHLDPRALQAVRIEHTRTLPGIGR